MAKLIRTNGETEEVEIPKADSLKFMQEKVGGYIEILPIAPNDGMCYMVLNEEGKIHGLPVNNVASRLVSYDIIVGDVLLCSEGEID